MGEATDDGLGRVHIGDLPPVRRPQPRPVPASDALGHHPLEISLDDGSPEVVSGTHGHLTPHERRGKLDAVESPDTLFEREIDDRPVVGKEVEDDAGHGNLAHRPLHRLGPGEVHPTLQALEGWRPIDERHDLPIEDQ